MPFWTKLKKTEQFAKRQLPAVDDSLWQSLRFLNWKCGSGHFLGRHGAGIKSFASNFNEYRPYTPGDDLRFIDQRILARTEKEYIKIATTESNLNCFFILDGTLSMDFGLDQASMKRGLDQDKFSFACGLTWLGANIFNRLGDSFGLYIYGRGKGTTLDAARGVHQLAALKKVLEEAVPLNDTNLEEGLSKAAPFLNKKTVGIIISDFICPGPNLITTLSDLCERGADLVLIQILTKKEKTCSMHGTVRLVDPETGNQVIINSDEISLAYKAIVTDQQMSLEKFAQKKNFPFLSIEPGMEYPASVWRRIFQYQNRKKL